MATDFYIGIDPGNTGAIAVIDSTGRMHALHDMPLRQVSKVAAVKHIPDPVALTDILYGYANFDVRCYVEHVSSAPNQGVASMFAFGRGLGTLEGVLAALRINYEFVTPQKWKWGFKLGKTEKSESLRRAREIFGEIIARDYLPLQKHHGRAEALLIARHGYETREVFNTCKNK